MPPGSHGTGYYLFNSSILTDYSLLNKAELFIVHNINRAAENFISKTLFFGMALLRLAEPRQRLSVIIALSL